MQKSSARQAQATQARANEWPACQQNSTPPWILSSRTLPQAKPIPAPLWSSTVEPPPTIPVDFHHWGRNLTSQNWWMTHLPEELIKSLDPAPSDPSPNPCHSSYLVPSHSDETSPQLQKTFSKHAWPHKPKLVNALLASRTIPLPWILSPMLLTLASTIWAHLCPRYWRDQGYKKHWILKYNQNNYSKSTGNIKLNRDKLKNNCTKIRNYIQYSIQSSN